jgi:hypothetical protein
MTSPTCSAAISAERSVDALSITITSPVRPELWMPSHAWFDDVATAASSFRHGIRTEISGGDCIGEPPYHRPDETVVSRITWAQRM